MILNMPGLKSREGPKQTSVGEHKLAYTVNSRQWVCLNLYSLLKIQSGHLSFCNLITRRGNHLKKYFKQKDDFLLSLLPVNLRIGFYTIIFLESMWLVKFL